MIEFKSTKERERFVEIYNRELQRTSQPLTAKNIASADLDIMREINGYPFDLPHALDIAIRLADSAIDFSERAKCGNDDDIDIDATIMSIKSLRANLVSQQTGVDEP